MDLSSKSSYCEFQYLWTGKVRKLTKYATFAVISIWREEELPFKSSILYTDCNN